MHPAHIEARPAAALRPPPAPPSRRLRQAFIAAMPRVSAPRHCLECGKGLEDRASDAQFCCTACRKRWNNRRMQRGAEIYDLFMITRYERPLARLKGLWTVMCALASAYRDADNHYRAGRRSWRRADDALEAIPFRYSAEGDKR